MWARRGPHSYEDRCQGLVIVWVSLSPHLGAGLRWGYACSCVQLALQTFWAIMCCCWPLSSLISRELQLKRAELCLPASYFTVSRISSAGWRQSIFSFVQTDSRWGVSCKRCLSLSILKECAGFVQIYFPCQWLRKMCFAIKSISFFICTLTSGRSGSIHHKQDLSYG